MKDKIATLLQTAAMKLMESGSFPNANQEASLPKVQVTIPKERKFGDYAANYAMACSKILGAKPRDIAEKLIEQIGDGDGIISKAEIAGPGFINFFVKKSEMFEALGKILDQGDDFGKTDFGRGEKVMVEFVSANPTGPLHVGHGRNAVYGDALSRIMQAAGFDVYKEYYVNDAGLQINTLGRSTFLRYRQLLGDKVQIPEGHYVGEYLVPIAEELRKQKGDDLTENDIPEIAQFAAKAILDGIVQDLGKIRVSFDNWFSEKTLHESGEVERTLDWMREKGLAYDKDGALWFASEKYGDDKDRVLIKSDKQKTYFAADLAYHKDKYDRGFDLAVNVWGADHHGYIPRMKAAVQSYGRDADDLDILLIQLVTLIRAGQVQQMSTRSGAFVLLAELADEVGADALRYFFLMRRHDAQLEFDIDLALTQSSKNPVFYVQYMHARICSIFKKAEQSEIPIPEFADVDVSKYEVVEEKELVRHLAEFPQKVANAAKNREPHSLIGYVHELASKFHYYYNHNRVITDDKELTAARLLLCRCAKQVLRNGLDLCGIKAPESM